MSWLSNLFKPKKEEAAQIQRPAKNPTFSLYKKTLEDRLAGLGVGFDRSVLNEATAPYAQARRENLNRYEIPTISSEASARGLGRSTIPVNRIAMSTQEAGRDIQEKIAQLTLANEEQKRNEINSALQGLSGAAGTEISAENARAAEAARVQNLNNQRAVESGQNLAIGGLQLVSPFLSEGLKTVFSKSPTGTYQADWGKAIDTAIGGNNASLVNLSKTSDSNSLKSLLELLKTLGA